MHLRASRTLGAPASAALAALAALAVLAAPSSAGAQPGGPPPPPPGYGGGYGGGYYGPPPARQGLTLGFGLGLGGMDSDSSLTECFDCNYDPLALGFDLHIGGMVNPQLAILGELFWQAQSIDADGFNWISQTMLMAAAQLWLTPQFWVKGGLGFASLDSHYDDGFVAEDDSIDTGLAVMGAAGFEVLSSPWFAIDLQLRLASGSYDGVDEQVNTGMLGIGFNWY
jgi:hypothetical protein